MCITLQKIVTSIQLLQRQSLDLAIIKKQTVPSSDNELPFILTDGINRRYRKTLKNTKPFIESGSTPDVDLNTSGWRCEDAPESSSVESPGQFARIIK